MLNLFIISLNRYANMFLLFKCPSQSSSLRMKFSSFLPNFLQWDVFSEWEKCSWNFGEGKESMTNFLQWKYEPISRLQRHLNLFLSSTFVIERNAIFSTTSLYKPSVNTLNNWQVSLGEPVLRANYALAQWSHGERYYVKFVEKQRAPLKSASRQNRRGTLANLLAHASEELGIARAWSRSRLLSLLFFPAVSLRLHNPRSDQLPNSGITPFRYCCRRRNAKKFCETSRLFATTFYSTLIVFNH